MKKLALLLAICFCFLARPATNSLAIDTGNYLDQEEGSLFRLPASLREIGESAFENTAVEMVILSESTESIGDGAFAHNNALRAVFVPDSVTYIGSQAFEGSAKLTIHGSADSYALQWAMENNVPFVMESSIPTWIKKIGKLFMGNMYYSLCFSCIWPGAVLRMRRRMEHVARSMRPQDRPELYPIDYRFP
jgi:hypothetical protein